MPAQTRSSRQPSRPRCVAVIFSPNDLLRAARLRNPPDFFELRLDALAFHLDELEARLPRLRAPFIITARHPREGGANNLSLAARRDLLLRFMPHAKFVDVELRSAEKLASILQIAVGKKIQRIISVHNFKATPSLAVLQKHLSGALHHHADIFKIATRVATKAEEARLLNFFHEANAKIATAAMALGPRARKTRIELARRGSALNYTYIDRAQAAGQLSLAEWRTIFADSPRPRRARIMLGKDSRF